MRPLLGLLLAAGGSRLPDPVRLALTTSFLGAYTTFSTFTVDALTLARAGTVPRAALYVVASVALGLAAAAAGDAVGRLLTR